MATRAISPINALLMVCLITFWGSSFIVVKVIIGEGLTPIAIATFRFLIAGGLFAITLFLKRLRNQDYAILIEKADFLKFLLLSLTGVTFFFIAQYTGIELAGASIAAILVCFLAPILISLFSVRLFKEQLTTLNAVGTGIAAAGTITVILGGTLNVNGNSTNFLFGSLILLLTPVMWAIYTLMGKKTMEKYDPFLVVAYVNILGGICLIPFSLAENSFQQVLLINMNEWLATLYLASTCSLLGYFIWFHVIKQVKAAVTSSFLFAEPLITVVFAAAFANEPITLFTAAGGFSVFAGVYMATRK